MCKIFSTFFLSYKNLHVLKIILFISFSLIYNFRIFAENNIIMNRLRILFAVVFCSVVTVVSAQKKYSVYGIGFYNQENLFDTCHDEGKNDYEYLPTGSNRWNARKYTHKLQNMARALADMGTDMLPNVGCAVIGLSEVENARALSDLVDQEPLRARGMKFVHIEGPDSRGSVITLGRH